MSQRTMNQRLRAIGEENPMLLRHLNKMFADAQGDIRTPSDLEDVVELIEDVIWMPKLRLEFSEKIQMSRTWNHARRQFDIDPVPESLYWTFTAFTDRAGASQTGWKYDTTQLRVLRETLELLEIVEASLRDQDANLYRDPDSE